MDSTDSIDAEVLHDLIEQFTSLIGAGAEPSIDEFVSAHPEHADALRKLLPATLLLNAFREPGREPDGISGQNLGRVGPLADMRLIRELGRGGMGVVFEAEQRSLKRRVAIKLLPFAALLSDRQLQRFRAEAEAAAMLKHPNIVSVYSVGSEQSVHFYVMELIEGLSLAEWIATRRLGETCGSPGYSDSAESPLSELLAVIGAKDATAFCRVAELAIQIADALNHAHARGVIHRDIKPGNLLLDRVGSIHLADFGMARTHTRDDLTMTGDLAGTLRYMSPEQLQGSAVDARTDIYSLGLTLYELIALRPAFDAEQRLDLVRQVADTDPPLLRRLVPSVPRDLESIIHKAIARLPGDRYSTPRALSDDLRRFVSGEPVRARSIQLPERVLRWCSRHRAKAALIGLCTMLLLVVAVGGPLVARQQADLAERRRRELYAAHIKEAHQAVLYGRHAQAADILRNYIPDSLAQSSDLRGFEWRWLWEETRRYVDAPRIESEAHTVHSIARSNDGSRIAFGSYFNPIRCIDSRSGEELWASPSEPGEVVYRDMVFTTDDRFLLAGTRTRELLVLNGMGHVVARHEMADSVQSLGYHPSGIVAVGCGSLLNRTRHEDPQPVPIRLFQLDDEEGKVTLTPISLLDGCVGTVHDVQFSPDGQQLIAGSSNGTICRWRVEGFESLEPLRFQRGMPTAIAFSPDGENLAVAVGLFQNRWLNTRVFVFDRADQLVWEDDADLLAATSIAFSPDGARLCGGFLNGTIQVWEARTGRRIETIHADSPALLTLAFGIGSSDLYSGGSGNAIRRWNLQTQCPKREIEADLSDVFSIGFTRDGKQIATVGLEHCVRVWRTDAGTLIRERQFSKPIQSLAISPAEDVIALGSKSGELEFWDLELEHQRGQLAGHPAGVTDVSFSPDGGQLLSSGERGGVRVWDVASGELIRELPRPEGVKGAILRCVYSPDGTRIGATGMQDTALVWSAESHQLEGQYRGDADEREAFFGIAFVDDNGTLALGDVLSGRIVLWNVVSGESRYFVGHSDGVLALGVSPCKRRLASGAKDYTVRIWDLQTGLELLTYRRPSCWVWRTRFSPDGALLAASTSVVKHSYNLLLWHAPLPVDTEN